jgi:3-hydroxyacyl-CoA dehydrogenase/enoyl-CoA hydratase/3-hydroxybutyryl-CoA epimerase
MKSAGLSVTHTPDGVALIALDVPGESQNTLHEGLLPAFEQLFDTLVSTGTTRAAVIYSTKQRSFIAGADIRMINSVSSAAEASELSANGQRAFDRIEALPFPVVAAINGACLGGGLELALACRARIAADTKDTVVGLPEVQLGLLPGAGGTQRLPELIGVAAALDLMLTGKRLSAPRAMKAGVVNEVVPASILLERATAVALALADDKPAPGKRKPSTKEKLQTAILEKNRLGQIVLFTQARRQTQDKTLGNYPAADRIINCVEAGAMHGRQRGLELEARSFGELAVSPESRALRHIFLSMTAVKADNGLEDGAQATPLSVDRIGVLGGGLMGAGIATVSTQKGGYSVRFKERDNEGLQRGIGHVSAEIGRAVKRKRLKQGEATPMLRRVTGSTDWHGFAGIDLFIEAVFEDLGLKQRLLSEVEAIGGDSTIFATNTSSIPIHRIAEAARRPERVIGMHYFSPVEKMPLLEIIITDKTAPDVITTCVEVGKKQGKNVIVVRDGVGFYTSRILAPYMNEAAFLLSEGVAIDEIDRAAREWGFPVGPFTLLDEVGLDVAAKVAPMMIDAFGHRMSPPDTTQKLAEDGRLGRKNGRGFYLYHAKTGKKSGVDTSVYDILGIKPVRSLDIVSIGERLGLAMVNEAILCLQENILRNPVDGDIGAVFGLGFPPFRGGPFKFVDEMGAAWTLDRLTALRDQHGHRFEPAQALVDLARSRGTFHT